MSVPSSSTHLPTRSYSSYHYVHPSLPPISSSYNPPSYTPQPKLSEKDKLYDISIKVEAVKASLHQAVDKTIERGQKLEETEERAKALEENSTRFYKGARKLKCMFCKQNARMIGCCILVMAIMIFIIVMLTKSYVN